MILADTSAWIDFLRGTERGRILADLLRAGSPVACSEPVLMEVLAGARTPAEYAQVRATLTGVAWLGVDPAGDFEAAARIYGMSRSIGITPRGLIDCLIVAIALRTGASVLTADRDVRRLAGVVDIDVVADA